MAGVEFSKEDEEIEPVSEEEFTKRQQEKDERIKAALDNIIEALQTQLQQTENKKVIHNIPVLFQTYSTDCGIACARMAEAYYGIPDKGTDAFIEEAKNSGIEIPITQATDGTSGPAGSHDVLWATAKRNSLEYQGWETTPDSAPEFYNAIIEGKPVQLSISFHKLNGNDGLRDRTHAILVKGYQQNENGELELIINDPKPNIGGEKTINKDQLAQALGNGFSVYAKK